MVRKLYLNKTVIRKLKNKMRLKVRDEEMGVSNIQRDEKLG